MKQHVLQSGIGRFHIFPNAATVTLAVSFLFGWLCTQADATERTWTGAVSAFWSDPSNWNPAGAPQDGDDLNFYDSGANQSMRNDLSGLTLDSVTFNSGNYILNGNLIAVSFFSTWGDTVTINCPFDFPEGSSSIEATGGALSLNGDMTTHTNAMPSVAAESGAQVDIAGAISGDGEFHVFASGASSSIEFNGAQDDTFSGPLYVEGDGQISFNKSSGYVVNSRLVADSIQVVNYANVNLMQPDQIGANTTIEIPRGTQLYLGGNNVTCQGVVLGTFNGDMAATLPTTLAVTKGALLGLNDGGIRAVCDDTNTPTITGRLNLNGFAPFDVEGSNSIGLQIDANIEGDGFQKTGNSTLILDGTNTFTGTAEVDEGNLDARNSVALGSTNGPTVLNGGSLTLHASISNETLTAQVLSTNGYAPDLPGASLFALSATPIIWSGPITLTTNLDVFGDDITFSGPINSPNGFGGLGLFNLGTVQLAGSDPNFFARTLVRCPLLELNKISEPPANPPAFGRTLEVGGGFGGPCEARWLRCCQVGDSIGRELIVHQNGIVNLNNFDDNFDSVTFNGGEIETGAGLFEIGETVTVNPTNTVAVINGNLAVGYAAFNEPITFNIGLGTVDPGLQVNAAISGNAELLKYGTGAMALAGPNTSSASTIIEQGTLEIENPLALGPSSCVIDDGATMQLDLSGSIPNNLETAGSGVGGTNGAIEATAGSSATLSGSIQLDSASTFNIASGAALGVSGVISGSGSLTKIGAGPLTLSGSSPNTFSGDTTNVSGLLYLAKSGGSVAVPGNLTLGPAPANAAASAIFLSADSIGGGAVTVNANSVLNLNGRNQILSQLNLNDGGSVQTGSGQLVLAGAAAVNVGSLRSGFSGGSHVSASIQGYVGLSPNTASPSFNVRPYAFSYPFDSRAELEVPANILVNGYEDPNEAPTGISKNGGGRMRLGGTNTFNGNTVVNSGTLQVDGTLPQIPYVIVNDGGTLSGDGSVGPIALEGASAALAPGDHPGILTAYNLDGLGIGYSGGTLDVELNGTTPGTQYDEFKAGYVNLQGVSLHATLGYAPATNDQFTIVSSTGPLTVNGTFNGLPNGAALALGGQVFRIAYGHSVVLTDIGKLVIPQLAIQDAGSNVVRLLWATNALTFRLQSLTNLNNPDPTNWLAVPSPPVVIGTNNVVTNAVTAMQTFYRLVNP